MGRLVNTFLEIWGREFHPAPWSSDRAEVSLALFFHTLNRSAERANESGNLLIAHALTDRKLSDHLRHRESVAILAKLSQKGLSDFRSFLLLLRGLLLSTGLLLLLSEQSGELFADFLRQSFASNSGVQGDSISHLILHTHYLFLVVWFIASYS